MWIYRLSCVSFVKGGICQVAFICFKIKKRERETHALMIQDASGYSAFVESHHNQSECKALTP